MRIIHCGDLHLDADLRTRFEPAEATERRAELMDTFRRLCRYAREQGVSAILICGDLFDTDSPSSSSVRTVEDLILGNGGILFFYLRGNHDSRPVLFRTRKKPENLFVFDDTWSSWELSARPSPLPSLTAPASILSCCTVRSGRGTRYRIPSRFL